MPSSNTITSTDLTTFAARTDILSAKMNTNFSIWRGHNLPVDASTSAAADAAYDLGSTSYRWRALYLSGGLNAASMSVTSFWANSISATQISSTTISATTLVATTISCTTIVGGTVSGTHVGDWKGNTITAAYGGTGITSYTTGDILYSNTTTGLAKLGIGSTGQVLKVSSGIPSWSAPPSGGINYISPYHDAEGNTTTGWATFADSAGSSPTDGTAGSPNTSWTITSTTPLRGTYHFLWDKTGSASRQGEGVSYAFSIDPADKGKVLQISFDYQVVSGTYADDQMSLWIYDVTNAKLIQPAPYLLKNHSLAGEKFASEFQSSSDSVSYRLIIFTGGTSTSNYRLAFDNFSVGPQAKLYGSPVKDWTAFTPTGSWSSNTTYTGFWCRVGDSMEVKFQVATAGAPTTASLTVNLPSGYTIDTAKMTSTGTQEAFGVAKILDGGTSTYEASIRYSSTTAIALVNRGASGTYVNEPSVVDQATPITFGAGDYVQGTFKVPITGWGSSAIMSQDADTRVVGSLYMGTPTGTISAAYNDVTYPTKVTDTHGAVSGTTHTVVVPGYYDIFAQASITGTFTSASVLNVAIAVNGTRLIQGKGNGVDTASITAQTALINKYLNAGDTIKIQTYLSSGTSPVWETSGTLNCFAVKKSSGPSQIAASESIYFSANTSVTAATTSTPFIYTSVDSNSHGAYSSTTGKFTAPAPGFYCFIGVMYVNATADFKFHKNGTSVSNSTGATNTIAATGSYSCYMAVGDTMEMRPNANQTASGGATLNQFSGFKVNR
jgi:hypothetical protein